MEFLRYHLPQYDFVSEEIPFDISKDELNAKRFDFLFSPSSFFAIYMTELGLRQIATRQSSSSKNPSYSVGSLFVVRKGSPKVDLKDLRGKVAVAEDEMSLASWLSAAGELEKNGYGSGEFFKSLIFTNYNYPDALTYLRTGRADVAILATCELESTPNGSREFEAVHVKENGYACLSSTDLYPDYVMSSFTRTDPDLIKDVTVKLFSMPGSDRGSQWSVASNFLSSMNLFRVLKLGPFKDKEFNLMEFYQKYRTEFALALVLALCLIFHIYHANRLVFLRTAELRTTIEQRDGVARTARQTLARLNQLEKRGYVSQLSSIFAHELKQPLATINNYAKGLKKYMTNQSNDDQIILGALEEIDKGSKRAADIVERVRAYAKSPAADNLTECNLAEIARQSVESFGAYVSWTRKVDCFFEKVCPIEANPLEIELVIVNLLRNAAEATESLADKGEIACIVRQNAGEVELMVRDNGPEISSEKLDRMRKSLQKSLKADGLGLGLSIVMGIAERQGARVVFSRRKPSGLEITVTFKAVNHADE